MLAIVMTVLNLEMARFGVGRHIQLSTFSDIQTILRLAFATRLIYQFALAFGKLAIAVFYLRIFPDRKSKFISYSIIAFIVGYTIPLVFLEAFQCERPSSASALAGPQICHYSQVSLVLATGILGILSDAALIIFVVPRINVFLLLSNVLTDQT